ncbi:hypothetical protein G3N59_01135 [Paraburkholderia sp. Ac-20340]|uniref:hypothetical protein n=1 Tax=Paraburkholderia sp. Ac-20340 TaxID=2703888 RepID=UPI0019826747|nr:hypothetical protein [Paraburkholderia sp. Ac-20340]MBN3851971.1 hypothetical protein [Paraburkholderia sp. Ac-20340]
MTDEVKVATYEMPDGTYRVEITHNGQTRSFTPDALSEHINVLAQVRESLIPPVRTSDPEVGEKTLATVDPRWWASYEQFIGGALLQVRHPGFGWQAFAIPLESLRALHYHLGEALATAEQAASAQKAS